MSIFAFLSAKVRKHRVKKVKRQQLLKKKQKRRSQQQDYQEDFQWFKEEGDEIEFEREKYFFEDERQRKWGNCFISSEIKVQMIREKCRKETGSATVPTVLAVLKQGWARLNIQLNSLNIIFEEGVVVGR